MPIKVTNITFNGMRARLFKSLEIDNDLMSDDCKISIDRCIFTKSSRNKCIDNKIKFLYYINCGHAKVKSNLMVDIHDASFIIKYADRRNGFDPIWFVVDLADYWIKLKSGGIKW
jgi:hypothetical protein